MTNTRYLPWSAMRLCAQGWRHVREDQSAASVIVAAGFDIGISQQEDGEDDGDNIPLRENQTRTRQAYMSVVQRDE